MTIEWMPKESQPSPDLSSGVLGWLKTNLFSSPLNSLLTLAGIAILYLAIPPFISWAFIHATWGGDSRAVCDAATAAGSNGACWSFIKVRMGVFLYGFYPEDQRWRINVLFVMLLVSLLPILAASLCKRTLSQIVIGVTGAAVCFLLGGCVCVVGAVARGCQCRGVTDAGEYP